MIWNFARRDLKSRFKGTAVGWAWSLLLPLATVAIYSIVFSVFIRIEPPPMGNGRNGTYAIWLLVGMVPWLFILNTITMSMPTILANGSLLQKVYFPSYVPTLGAMLAIGVQSLIELGVVLALLGVMANVGWSWLLVPLWVAALVAFTGSVAYSLAVLNVFYRDVAQLVAVAMQLLFFLSAIIYPITLVPDQWHGIPVRTIMELNPIAVFLEIGRALLYDLSFPSLLEWAYAGGWLVASVALAVVAFKRWGRDVGEFV